MAMRPFPTGVLTLSLVGIGQVTADASQCRGVSFDPACRGLTRPAVAVTFSANDQETPKPPAPTAPSPVHPREHGLVARTERPVIDCKMPTISHDGQFDLKTRVVRPAPHLHFNTPVIAMPSCAAEASRPVLGHAPVRR